MGLDQYFYEKRYLRMKAKALKNESDRPSIRVEAYTDIRGQKHDAEIIDGVSSLIRQVGYFRKANEIQAFIEDKYAADFGGDINCKDVYLTKDVIMELYDICKELLAIKGKKKFTEVAAEKLPTCSGFFFGSTEYDEYYKEDLRQYVNMVDKMDLDNENIDYYYHCWY